MVVPDPLPLAYAVYAFINVDNCERPPYNDASHIALSHIMSRNWKNPGLEHGGLSQGFVMI